MAVVEKHRCQCEVNFHWRAKLEKMAKIVAIVTRCSFALVISVLVVASGADEPYHDPYNDPVSARERESNHVNEMA